jgi:hypothetical protein
VVKFDHVNPEMHFDYPIFELPDKHAQAELNWLLAKQGRETVHEFLRFCATEYPPPGIGSESVAERWCDVTHVSAGFVSVFCHAWGDYGAARYMYDLHTWRIADGHAIAIHYDDVFDRTKRKALVQWMFDDACRQAEGRHEVLADNDPEYVARIDKLADDFVFDREGIGYHFPEGYVSCMGCGNFAVTLSWARARTFAKPNSLLTDLEVAALNLDSWGANLRAVHGPLRAK